MIVAVVQQYIHAMSARDTSQLRQTTLAGASFVSLMVPGAPADQPRVRTVDEFIAGQGRETRRFVGRIWAARVSVEGPIAVLIAPYDAYFDGVFSHCGTDHYIMARSGGRWLVSQLIWTVQRDNCPASPLGPLR